MGIGYTSFSASMAMELKNKRQDSFADKIMRGFSCSFEGYLYSNVAKLTFWLSQSEKTKSLVFPLTFVFSYQLLLLIVLY